MLAACVLLKMGLVGDANAAISRVRLLRCPTAVETSRQEAFVSDYAVHLSLLQPQPSNQQ